MVHKATAADLCQDQTATKEGNAVRAVAVGMNGATLKVRVRAPSSDYLLTRNPRSLSSRRILRIRTLPFGSLEEPEKEIHKAMPVVTKVVTKVDHPSWETYLSLIPSPTRPLNPSPQRSY